MSVDIQVYSGGPCACNGYLVRCAHGYVAVDAPMGFAAWVSRKLPQGEPLTDLLITHQHFDHVQGVAELVQRFGCRVHACMPYSLALTLEEALSNMYGGRLSPEYEVPPFCVDNAFGSGCRSLNCAGTEWSVHHIPGHSTDGVAYGLPESEQLFCGDILFAGAVGRTDFPGGSMAALVRGIRSELLPLPHSTVVHSGHGPSTTMGEESLNNPYL